MRISVYLSRFSAIFFLAIAGFFLPPADQALALVKIEGNQLVIDGVPQPQLYGAELQYFRLRGGYGPNVPRARVLELWNRALARMVEAKMNSVSFYIPWDFHEYAPGRFDFTGTADTDGDGNADYPARDLKTFFRLLEQHGISRIMVRPGPYINAEWGFLGFGAIPLWFHELYPDSHMRNAQGLRTKLYDYHSPDLLRHTRQWFSALHEQVLKNRIGPGKPIAFLQLDNETNFMWQSLYNHDYGPRAVERYRTFLRETYGTIAALNAAFGTTWPSWESVFPPTTPRANNVADQAWYRFQDESIHSYLKIVRAEWERLGVLEPDVIFTLAESYNATENGLLPNFHRRNDPGKTGLITMNMYPKTYEAESRPLLNLPFKVDHDVKAMTAASERYLGSRQEWLMGPEIQGGWWRGIQVTPASRQQTYLSSIGHGLKALFIYYFTEGDNWQSEWAKEAIAPLFAEIRQQAPYRDIPEGDLPQSFWKDVQDHVDRQLLVGFDVRGIWRATSAEGERLYFDAPLDGDALPRPNFRLLRKIGEKIVAPHGGKLAASTALTDPVAILKDVDMHAPSPNPAIDSVRMNADWSGALLGYLMQTGVNPKILHWGLNSPSEIGACKIIFVQSNGILAPALVSFLRDYVERGGTVVTLLDDRLPRELEPATATGRVHHFSSPNYATFNSDGYASMTDVPARRAILEDILLAAGVTPALRIAEGGDRVVAFARAVDAVRGTMWLTIKSGQTEPVAVHVQMGAQHVPDKDRIYRVHDLLEGVSTTIRGADLVARGIPVRLGENGSAAFLVE